MEIADIGGLSNRTDIGIYYPKIGIGQKNVYKNCFETKSSIYNNFKTKNVERFFQKRNH